MQIIDHTAQIQSISDAIALLNKDLPAIAKKITASQKLLVKYRENVAGIAPKIKAKLEAREALDEQIGDLPATDKQLNTIVQLECDIQQLKNELAVANQKLEEQETISRNLDGDHAGITARLNRQTAALKTYSLAQELVDIEHRWLVAYPEMIAQARAAGIQPYDPKLFRPSPYFATELRRYGVI